MVQATTKFFYLACPDKIVKLSISQVIKWMAPNEPFIKLNTDGSFLDNPGMAGAGGLLRDSSGSWISRFSLSMGITTNNMAELGAVHQGLMLAWDLRFKFIQLEIDSMIVLIWLTTTTSNFPLDVFPLLCDSRNLIERAWEVQVHHVYHEANECADVLAKQGNHQQQLLEIYNTCPNLVYQCFVRDMVGLGSSKICPLRLDMVVDV